MREITVFGLDVAKNVFEVAGLGRRDQLVVKRRLRRPQVLAWFAEQPRVLVGLEACPGSHYWARELQKLGFEVKMIPAQHTKAYRTGHQKNDSRDAVAIAQAARSEQVHEVAVKSESQLQMQALFRFRELLMKQRIALSNQIRMLLLEYGVALPKSDQAMKAGVREAIEGGDLPELFCGYLRTALEEHRRLDGQIKAQDRSIETMVKSNELSARLLTMPGVGPQTAAYVTGVIGGPGGYRSGRDFAAKAGLVPRQHSSGEKRHLGGITKRGDRTLRSLLVHGARAVLTSYKGDAAIAQWGRQVAARRGFNKACVAVANKMARHIWAEMERHALTA